MSGYRLLAAAERRIGEIYLYTLETWGEAQARRYVFDLYDVFEQIATGQAVSQPIPASYGIQGFVTRHGSHRIYWRRLEDGRVGIVTVLHARMDLPRHLRDDLPP